MATYFQPGRYWGKLTSHQLGETSKGTPQMVFSFTIVGAVNPNDPDGELLSAPSGERSVFRPITEKTKDWFWRNCDALCEAKGIDQCDTPGEISRANLAGAEVALECKHEVNDKNETKERWDIYSGAGKLEVKPLEPTAAAQLDALFGRAKLNGAPKPRRQPAGSTNDQSAAKAATAASGGDIPF